MILATGQQCLEIELYRSVMKTSNRDPVFVDRVCEIAYLDKAMFDLLVLWFLADGNDKTEEVENEIYKTIKDYDNKP